MGVNILCTKNFLPALLTAAVLWAAPLAAQEAATLLEVEHADGEIVTFDLAQLDALPQVDVVTSTQWTEGVLTFSGPSLAAVLTAAELPMAPVDAVATNGYAVRLSFPPGDETVPIVATRIDGVPIDRRDKGPLWVVFPYDADDTYRTAEVFAQSIWHLERLIAAPDE
jgi:hypothetical protein